MHSLWSDLRYALRVFRAHPGVTAIALLSLALGIGANSIIFSLVDGMFLRPLPVRDPKGIVWVQSRTSEGRESGLGWLDYLDLKQSAAAFSDIAVQNRRGGLLSTQDEAEMVLVTVVSDNYFPLLGVEAARGRLFREDLDAALAAQPAAAISDSLWRRRFGADPGMIGRAIRLNNRAFTVVGILPPEFRSLNRALRNDIWVPVGTWKAMGGQREFQERGSGSFEGLARLRPGATLAQAQAQLDALTSRFAQEYPDQYRGRRLAASTEEARQVRAAKPGVIFLAISGLLVLIACVNVAVLMLAQAEMRTREIGIRLALGAGRRRLVRQLLTESALLAVCGCVLALLVARWLVPLLPTLFPPGPDFVRFDVRVDVRVLLVTLVTCAATALLFGLTPALQASRTDLNGVIKSGGRQQSRGSRGRSLLVAGQAALAVVLLTAAALLTRSFLYSEQLRPGFDTDRNLLSLLAAVPNFRVRAAFTSDAVSDRVRGLAGVRRVAYCRRLPMAGQGGGSAREVVIPGRQAAPGQELLRIRYNQVSPDYFDVLGTRLLSGRAFTHADSATAGRVALVNQTMARQFWPSADPIGQWIKVDNTDTQIAGIVEDTAISRIHEPPEPFLYFPFAQAPAGEVTFLVETQGDPAPLLPAVKREMRAAQPDLALLMTTSLRQHLRNALYEDWLPAVLSASIGGLGMLLAAAGLFGVVMHAVNRSLKELGVRMALGARRGGVVAMVLRRGLFLAGSGAAAGVALSLAAGRLLSGALHGVSPYDPLAMAFGVAVVLAMAIAASVYPAWKATRVDPISVLREE